MTAKFASDPIEVSKIEYRVEKKYLVSDLDLTILAHRLKTVMGQDIHQEGSCYEIRSVYFDDIADSCLEENDAGIDLRKKYRIRTYGAEGEPLKLEIKEKSGNLTKKTGCRLTREEFDRIMAGGHTMNFGRRTPLNRWLLQQRCAGLMPKLIIAYERTAFVHPVGNVRITFDRNIMASRELDSFFATHISGLVPVLPTGMHVLEVKYDELLPDAVARQLEIGKLRQTAFSKYYLGRLAAAGEFPVTGR